MIILCYNDYIIIHTIKNNHYYVIKIKNKYYIFKIEFYQILYLNYCSYFHGTCSSVEKKYSLNSFLTSEASNELLRGILGKFWNDV